MIALAVPMRDPAGQLAGLAANVLAGHAFCSVVCRDGSLRGSETFAMAMFAWPGPLGKVSFASKPAPVARLVLPVTLTLNPGRKRRPAQLAAW